MFKADKAPTEEFSYTERSKSVDLLSGESEKCIYLSQRILELELSFRMISAPPFFQLEKSSPPQVLCPD